jgi:hypothetical protein
MKGLSCCPLKGQQRGTIFPHLKSAARHLLEQNQRDASVSVTTIDTPAGAPGGFCVTAIR